MTAKGPISGILSLLVVTVVMAPCLMAQSLASEWFRAAMFFSRRNSLI
jgi:hypothetical protein